MLKPRFLGALLAAFSLVVVAFAALPSAQAETVSLRLTTPMIPVGADGTAKVWGVCMTSTTCKGWIGFSETDDPAARVGTQYSVPAGKSQYVTIKMRTTWNTNNGAVSQYDPYAADTVGRHQVGTDGHQQPIFEAPAQIQVNPTGDDPQSPWATTVQTSTLSDSVLLTTPAIAIDSNGQGKVWGQCLTAKACKGWIGFNEADDPAARVGKQYSIPGKSSAYISVEMRIQGHTNNGAISQYDPYSSSSAGRHTVGTSVGGQPVYEVPKAQILLNPTGAPAQAPVVKDVQTVLPGGQQKISGSVTSAAAQGRMTDVTVQLRQPLKGGNYDDVASVSLGAINPGGSANFELKTPANSMVNNVSSASYQLRIRARDDQQEWHEWWWRGTEANPFTGGTRYPRTATALKPGLQPTTANFRYGSIAGVAKVDGETGDDVSVAAISAPSDFSSSLNSTVLRELDVESCGDEYARVRSDDGSYRLDFLPAPLSGPENHYLVRAFKDDGDAKVVDGLQLANSEGWTKSAPGGASYGTCYQALDYELSPLEGMQFGGSGTLGGVNVNVVTPQHAKAEASIDLNYRKFGDSRGAWTDYSDQWVMFRMYIPGLPRNDSPVVVQGMAKDSPTAEDPDLSTEFKLPPGRYWVETGRRGAGCAMWYPSVYPDNNAYFKGEDRGAEKWKVVAKGKSPSATAIAHGFNTLKVGSLGSGKSWMYRDYCKTINEGTVTLPKVDIPAGFEGTVTLPVADGSIKAGAVVSGTVKRAGGKTNKEMMVRLSSTDTAWGVIRVDLTDSKGKFYVAGLPAGTYKVQVNSDSWRGIGRSFTGTKTITVKAGKTYSIGTLNFSG